MPSTSRVIRVSPSGVIATCAMASAAGTRVLGTACHAGRRWPQTHGCTGSETHSCATRTLKMLPAADPNRCAGKPEPTHPHKRRAHRQASWHAAGTCQFIRAMQNIKYHSLKCTPTARRAARASRRCFAASVGCTRRSRPYDRWRATECEAHPPHTRHVVAVTSPCRSLCALNVRGRRSFPSVARPHCTSSATLTHQRRATPQRRCRYRTCGNAGIGGRGGGVAGPEVWV